MRGDCLNCDHAIGYHHQWVNTEDEMFCTAGEAGGECTCPGYRSENFETPQTGPYSLALKARQN